jgi:hypothetical protein
MGIGQVEAARGLVTITRARAVQHDWLAVPSIC